MNRIPVLFVLIILIQCKLDLASDSGDSTLFTILLPASQTNVFVNNPPLYGRIFNPYTYRNFYNGGGVGMGDINNDGMLDLFFAATRWTVNCI